MNHELHPGQLARFPGSFLGEDPADGMAGFRNHVFRNEYIQGNPHERTRAQSTTDKNIKAVESFLPLPFFHRKKADVVKLGESALR